MEMASYGGATTSTFSIFIFAVYNFPECYSQINAKNGLFKHTEVGYNTTILRKKNFVRFVFQK